MENSNCKKSKERTSPFFYYFVPYLVVCVRFSSRRFVAPVNFGETAIRAQPPRVCVSDARDGQGEHGGTGGRTFPPRRRAARTAMFLPWRLCQLSLLLGRLGVVRRSNCGSTGPARGNRAGQNASAPNANRGMRLKHADQMSGGADAVDRVSRALLFCLSLPPVNT